MKTAELKDRIALTLVKNDERIIAASPIIKQPGCLPYRIVIVNWGHEFSVHSQHFSDPATFGTLVPFATLVDLGLSCETQFKSCLESGHYFKTEEFDKCLERFAEKCKQFASLAKPLMTQSKEESLV